MAFILGILSSLHCIGMCGPIALAMPAVRKNFFTQFLSWIVYNSGRTISYVAIGIAAGSVGTIFFRSGLQQWISIMAGIMILIWVIVPKTNPENWRMFNNNAIVRFIKKNMGRLFKRKNYASILAIGLMNGLLPCGMVYMAVAGAFTSPDFYEGGLYMLFFGLGTWPLMFILLSSWQMIDQKFKSSLRRWVPYMVGMIGIMLIIRGAGLGIPYLSPVVNAQSPTMTTCK